jgi:maltose alpha-D-glucosyltransferase / alpha-amylase
VTGRSGQYAPMTERWYKEAVIYCLDVDTFQDSDGDGYGDLRGLISRLDYLSRLGVTSLWLNPIHPSPGRDDGYDVSDFYGVHPRIGSLGDFAELVHEASGRGIRVMMDLVVNHTSDEHPWFVSARSSPDSPYRDWYVWSETEPPDRTQGMVFPGEQKETWTWCEEAQAWYYHRFYDFMPDLDTANPEVWAEIKKIMAFWTQLGVAGFRMDAVPFVIEQTVPGEPAGTKDFEKLTDLRAHLSWRKGDAVLLAEANVEPDQLPEYFGDKSGSGNRIHMLFDFMLNGKVMLALARGEAEPVLDRLTTPIPLPAGGQWATFLRNHDEVDLSRLTAEQRREVFALFGPEKNMQLYDRGIRRRLAPMLGGDQRRIRLAYSLQFTLPGTPVLRYGEEIGMGEELSLPGRNAIRTPMQWGDQPNGGFSTAEPDQLVRPVISDGKYGYRKVNVTAQRRDPDSLLSWFQGMIRTLRECPEIGTGQAGVLDVPVPREVLAHRCQSAEGCVVFLHNLGADEVTVDLGPLPGLDTAEGPVEVFADQGYDRPTADLRGLRVAGHGYRWIRVQQVHSGGLSRSS